VLEDLFAWASESWIGFLVVWGLALLLLQIGFLMPLRRIFDYLSWRTGRFILVWTILRCIALPDGFFPVKSAEPHPEGAYGCFLLVPIALFGIAAGLGGEARGWALAAGATALLGLWILGLHLNDKNGSKDRRG
jgi:hypothetical protein